MGRIGSQKVGSAGGVYGLGPNTYLARSQNRSDSVSQPDPTRIAMHAGQPGLTRFDRHSLFRED